MAFLLSSFKELTSDRLWRDPQWLLSSIISPLMASFGIVSLIRAALQVYSVSSSKVITTATGRKVSVAASSGSNHASKKIPIIQILLGGLSMAVYLYLRRVILLKGPNSSSPTLSISNSIIYMTALAVLIQSIYNTFFQKTSNSASKTTSNSKGSKNISNGQENQLTEEEYFTQSLINNSNTSQITHMDVLYCVASCPELLKGTQDFLNNVQEQMNKKKQLLLRKQHMSSTTGAASEKNPQPNATFQLDESGWADDDDDDDDANSKEQNEEQHQRAMKLKILEEEKKIEQKQMAALLVNKTNNNKKDDSSEEQLLQTKFEELDEGVLGQEWVESILQSLNVWPKPIQPSQFFPTEDLLTGNPAVRRNMCMLVARLHSQKLNNHPALTEAGPKGMVDSSYFSHSVQFRQRFGALMEAVLLRLALTHKNYDLSVIIMEAICMFKIGVSSMDKKTINWFNGVVLQTYGGMDGLPRLKITDTFIEMPEKSEIATLDAAVFTMTIERTHAEKFLEHKMNLCKLQNLDPRMVLASYQEVWWVLVRASCSGTTTLLTAFPFIVRNIAQKAGKIKCKFTAPEKPGHYKFIVDIKSQEFLGADQTFELEYDIVDRATVDRSDDEEEDDDEDDDEGKKDK
mmetsp:Transcript_12412/g.17854  ORF Transcript_12412/g.17854 Transcript_12412/m.17854 type:complete len:630 (-) Transcript_12412:10-1899(-)